MEKCLKNSEIRNERILRNASIVMLSLYAVLAYIDIISVMVPFVLASYGVMSVLSVAYIVFYFRVRKNSCSLDITNVSFICFAFFTVVSMIVKKGALDRNAVAIFNILQILCICLIVKELFYDINNILFYFCSGVTFFCLIIIALSPSVFSAVDRNLANGLTPNVNAMGMLMTAASMVSLYLVLFCKNKFYRILQSVFFCLFVFVLIKTGSRTALMCLLAGVCSFCFFLGVKKLKGHKVLTWIIAILIIVVFLFLIFNFIFVKRSNATLLSGREELWQASISALKGHMVFGFGGNTQLMIENYKAKTDLSYYGTVECHLMHNIYIQVLVEYGIIVFCAFLCMLFSSIISFLICFIKRDSFINGTDIWCFSMFIVYCIHGFAESSILYIGGPEQFTFIFFAVFIYLTSRSRENEV